MSGNTAMSSQWSNILLAILCCTYPSFSCKTEQFILDYAKAYSILEVTIVTNSEEVNFSSMQLPIGFISYMNSEVQAVVDHIRKAQNDLETLFFIGSDHSHLLQMLDNSTGLFHSHIVSVMEDHKNVDFHLRLDTNIVFCNQTDAYYSLTERYAIKGGQKITKPIGYWHPESGLHIKTPVLWERRSDLMNIKLTDSILPYSVLTKIVKNEKGEIIKQSGIFQAQHVIHNIICSSILYIIMCPNPSSHDHPYSVTGSVADDMFDSRMYLQFSKQN